MQAYISKITFSLSLILLLGGGARAQQQEAVTLREAINFSLRNHPNSTIYRYSVQSASEKIRESKAAFLPSVAGSLGMDYNIKLQTTVIPAGSFSPTETKLQMGNKFSNSASVQADQNIFDKASQLGIQSAKIDKEVADLNVLKQNETIIYNTAKAYYEVLSYHEKGKLLLESEKQYETTVGILKVRFEQGVVKKSEYDKARVNLNNVRSESEANGSNYQLSVNKLKNAMGLELDAALQVEDSVAVSEWKDLSLLTYGGEDIATTLDYRIDQKNLLLKELDIRKKKAAFLPTVSAYAKYGASGFGSEFFPALGNWFDYSTIGLKATIPIFSGFKKESQLAQSRISLASQKLTNILNVQNYKLEIQNALTQWTSSYANLKKNQENLALAQEMMESTMVEYREGTANLSALMDAEYAYKEARTNYITTLLDYLNAQLGYQKNNGTLTEFVNNLK